MNQGYGQVQEMKCLICGSVNLRSNPRPRNQPAADLYPDGVPSVSRSYYLCDKGHEVVIEMAR